VQARPQRPRGSHAGERTHRVWQDWRAWGKLALLLSWLTKPEPRARALDKQTWLIWALNVNDINGLTLWLKEWASSTKSLKSLGRLTERNTKRILQQLHLTLLASAPGFSK
jgi:hypothetical protein